MPRTPKPWWRRDRQAWFVTMHDERHNLGPARDQAFQRFYDRMAQMAVTRPPTVSPTFLVILDRLLDWMQRHRAGKTYHLYRKRCRSFVRWPRSCGLAWYQEASERSDTSILDARLINSSILIMMLLVSCFCVSTTATAQVVIRGDRIFTMAGPPIDNGTVVVRDGKIAAIGKSTDINVPDGFEVLEAAVVTPGLIDAHSVVGLAGMLNQDQDQDQLERSTPIQPALRAIDGYNSHDELIAWIRGFGVTTVHTGHAPGELISGQTMVVKTTGNTVSEALLVETRAVAATLSTSARKADDKSPGTRGKMMAMLRSQLIAAREYQQKRQAAAGDDEQEPPPRDLALDALVDVLSGKTPLLITAERAQDISNALRLSQEFGFRLWLDGAAESYLLIDEIKQAGVPVIIHPTMARATGDRENQGFETAAKLVSAGIPVALQSGYESYVPKTRVVLFEAALAAANGLSFEQALATITIDAARILGVQDRIGSLEVGKDGDLALYDGDPFEYTSHCVGVILNGVIVSRDEH